MAETPLRTKTRDSMPQRPLGRVGVTQVYPQVGQDLETNVDIFAIHGLDTTSPETWTFKYDEVVNRLLKGKRKRSRSEDGQQEKDVNWLTSPDMLPHDIPKARIFTCNWPSQLYHDPDTIEMTISELSRILFSDIQSERCQLGASKHRPVIFIASSLGGIILAKAFILAAEPKSDYEDLRAATAGVIFLGTPFRGTALADLFGVAMMSLEAKGFFRRQALARGLLDNLGKSTANLEELVNHFTTRCCLNSKVFIYCFYETVQSDLVAKALPKQTPDWLKKSLAQPKLLVDSSSARLDIAKESIPLQVAHVMMNKFPGPEDAHYRRVRGKIQESVQHALKLRDQALGFTGEDGRCWKILTEKIPSAGHEMQTIEDRKEPLIASCSNWILERFDWKRWRDTLVVHLEGGPGTGKTMTMMHLVNHHLSDQCHRDVAYFFFQGESKNECAFYRGLIYHLIRNSRNDDLISHLSQGLARSSDNAIDEAVALREILKRMLSEVKQSLLFVDGLDECQDRQDLKHVLSFIIATATDLDTKWVISSRVDFTITQSLEFASKRCKVNSICLATELTGASVSEYIQHKVTSLAKTKSYSSELQQNVQSILQARSEGIFLWVSLVCEVLQDDNESWNDEEVLDLLRMLPQGLPEIYKHILAKLRGLARRWNDCAAVLATVVTAERPLHLAELALLTHPDKKLQKEHAKKCVELCSNFLILQTDVVYFFHQSAKDFLLELLEKPTDEIFPHEICDRNRTILLASLRSMKDLKEDMYGLKDPAVDIDDIKEPPLGDPLLPLTYSCESWAYHLVAAFPDLKPCSTCPQMLNSLEEVFNFMSRSLLYWMEALCLKRLLYKGVASIRMLERFSSQSESRKLYALVHDATRFILKSMPIIESTPLQIYSSALLFAPETSIVRKLFLRKDYPVKVTLGLDQSWDQTLQIFEGPSPVRKVAVSSSGNRMASAYFDGTVKVWDAATGRVELEYRVSSEFVTDLAFSPDESKLASSNGPETGVWDIATSQAVWTTLCVPSSRDLAWLDETRLMVATFEAVRILNAATGLIVGSLDVLSFTFYNFSFCPRNSRLMLGSSDGTIEILDVATGQVEQSFKDKMPAIIQNLAISPDGSTLASSNHDTIYLWQVATGQIERVLKASAFITSLLLWPDGSKLASATYDEGGTINIWDVATGEILQLFKGHTDTVYDLALSPNEEKLITGSEDATTRVWDVTMMHIEPSLESHSQEVCCLMFSPDGSMLASASVDEMLIHELATGNLVHKSCEQSDQIECLEYSSDGSMLASAKLDEIWIPELATGNLVYKSCEQSDQIGCLAFSSDRLKLASGSSHGTIKVWNITTRSVEHTFMVPQDRLIPKLNFLTFSADGSKLAACVNDGHIWLWGITKRSPVALLMSLYAPRAASISILSLAFSPDGSKLVIGAYNTIDVWDLSTKEIEQNFECMWETEKAFYLFLAFSEDGKKLVSGSSDGKVRVWDMATGQIMHTLHDYSSTAASPYASLYYSSRKPGDSSIGSQKFYSFNQDETWVVLEGSKFLRLPLDHRSRCVAATKSALAIGGRSGRVTILYFPENSDY